MLGQLLLRKSIKASSLEPVLVHCILIKLQEYEIEKSQFTSVITLSPPLREALQREMCAITMNRRMKISYDEINE